MRGARSTLPGVCSVRAVSNQESDDIAPFCLLCELKRSLLAGDSIHVLPGDDVHIGAGVDQELNGFQRRPFSGPHERSSAPVVPSVDIESMFHQQANNLSGLTSALPAESEATTCRTSTSGKKAPDNVGVLI